MAPRSLVEMCTRIIINNITEVPSLAMVPHRSVEEILPHVKSAEQLHRLELTSDIYDQTEGHWRRIIKKDFPLLSSRNSWVPANPKSWYSVWKRYKKTQEASIAAATEMLANKFAEEQKKKADRKTEFIENSRAATLAHLRQPARASRPSSSGPHWSTQPRVRQTPLSKVRTQVRAEASRLKVSSRSLTFAPTKITKAPESMLRDKRVARQLDPATATTSSIRAPRPRPARALGEADREQKEREDRLRRIKNPDASTKAKEVVITFSDDEGDDGAGGSDNLADLFGELEGDTPKSTPTRSREQTTASPTTGPSRARRGLLSAAPGMTKTTRIISKSPPAATPPAPTPPRPAPAPMSTPPTSRPHPVFAAAAAQKKAPVLIKRKDNVDIFMRSSKRVRR